MKTNEYCGMMIVIFLLFFPMLRAKELNGSIYEKTCFTGKVHFSTSPGSQSHFDADEPLRSIRCHTKAPSCGIKMDFEVHDKMSIQHVQFGCFQRADLHHRLLVDTTKTYRILMENAKEQYNIAKRQIPTFEDYYEKFKPKNDTDHEEQFESEQNWVENAMEKVPLLRKKTKTNLGTGDSGIELSKNQLSPVMLLYVIFIIASVIIRTIWLIKTALKQYREGYAAVPVVPNNLTTVEE